MAGAPSEFQEGIADGAWWALRRESQSMWWDEGWRIRAQITGRGNGKTRAGAEALIEAARHRGVKEMGAVGRTHSEAMDTMARALIEAAVREFGTGAVRVRAERGGRTRIWLPGGASVRHLLSGES